MNVLWMVDGVLAVLVVEALVLASLPQKTRSRTRLPRFATLLPNLAAGFFLVLALRSAVRGDGLAVIGACLALAGVAHAIDLRQRSR